MAQGADVTLGLTWQDAIQGKRVWHVGVREVCDGDVLARVSAWWHVTERGGAWNMCSRGKNFS